jgi:REP-associated tyrosine transposase
MVLIWRMQKGPTKGVLGTIVRSFKSAAMREVNMQYGEPGETIWQRNYYEHVVRDEGELERIRDYIDANPPCWDKDKENPSSSHSY